jgi:hypothetical protein
MLVLLTNIFGAFLNSTKYEFLFQKILVPLLLVQLSLILLPGEYSTVRSNSNGLLGAALILSGLTQSRAHGLIQAACIIKNLGIDLAFYLFTFFIAHALLQYIQI